MKINATDTQIQAYREVNESGQVEREQRIVLKALKENEPCTRRELHLITGIEIGNLCRCLYNLRKVTPPQKPLVEIAFKNRCKTTGMTVHYYQTVKEGGAS